MPASNRSASPHHAGVAPRVRNRSGTRHRRRQLADDTGDVPGWVLVTLMTAGLVLALWAVAGPVLTELFETAIQRVTEFGG